MTYQKQTWNNYNDSLSIEQNKANNAFATPEGLNHIETGIEQVEFSLNQQLAENNEKMDGVIINALFPPTPFMPLKSDANFYDSENFKYYTDSSKRVEATDNAPRLQALVDYLTNKGGGTIQLPRGMFVFRSAVIWKTKVSLFGSGKGSTFLFAEGIRHSLIQETTGKTDGSSVDVPGIWKEDCTFKDFTIDNKGLSLTTPDVGGKGIFILYMKRALFRDLVILNTIGTGLGSDFLVDSVIDNVFVQNAGRNSIATGGYGGNSGIGIGTCSLSQEPLVITNCFTYNCGNYGVFVETQKNPSGVKTKGAKIVNTHSQGNKLGFGNKGSGPTQFIGCTAYKNRVHGFHLTQGAFGDQLIGCFSEENGEDGLRVERDYGKELKVSDFVANRNGGSGIRLTASNDTLDDVSISNVIANENGFCGIWVEGNTKRLKINNVTTNKNGEKSPKYNRGILVGGVNDQTSIIGTTASDNQVVKTQLVGIEISAGTTNYILDSNNVIGYEQNSGYLIKSTAGVIGKNGGLVREKYGSAKMLDGDIVIEVVHGLGTLPKKISLVPYDRTATKSPSIWVDRVDGNMIRVRREATIGDLDFYWEVKL